MTEDEAARKRNRDFGIALDGHAAGKGIRMIVEDVYGIETGAADWSPDSGFRARTRRLLRKARVEAGQG